MKSCLMPKIGQEPARRAALVNATISEIGLACSLDVTVGQIARRAGMSTALAHYYFESKDAIFLAAMRHIISEYGRAVRALLHPDQSPRERLSAIVEASLGRDQFADEIVSAWLVFYVEAQRSPEAGRLLKIYARRLHSNLVYGLRFLVDPPAAHGIAQGAASMIDGIYIRHALQSDAPSRPQARALVNNYIDLNIARYSAKTED